MVQSIRFVSAIVLLVGLAHPDVSAYSPEVADPSPSSPLTIDVGDSVRFGVTVRDPDGDLNRTYFVVDRSIQGITQCSLPCFEQRIERDHAFLEAGSHEVWMFSYDQPIDSPYPNRSNVAVWKVQVVQPNTPPSLERLSPAETEAVPVGQSVTFRVWAQDPDRNLAGVEFRSGADRFWAACTSGCGYGEAAWSRAFAEAGTYHVLATARDLTGLESNRINWTVTVAAPSSSPNPSASPTPPPNRAPSLSLLRPHVSFTIAPNQSVEFLARAEDPDSNLAKILVELDGAFQGQSACSASCSFLEARWQHTFPEPGSHLVTVRADDAEGASSSPASWSVSVEESAEPTSSPQPSPTPTQGATSSPGPEPAPTSSTQSSETPVPISPAPANDLFEAPIWIPGPDPYAPLPPQALDPVESCADGAPCVSGVSPGLDGLIALGSIAVLLLVMRARGRSR